MNKMIISVSFDIEIVTELTALSFTVIPCRLFFSCCGWLAGGWLAGGWLAGGWLAGGWLESDLVGCGASCCNLEINMPSGESFVLARSFLTVYGERPNT
jgi:hypothetical protein